MLQSQLRHPVVKAFNTIRPASLASLGKPAEATGRPAPLDWPMIANDGAPTASAMPSPSRAWWRRP